MRKYGVNPADDILGTTTFTLLDTDLKFIAHSEALVSPMKQIFMEWGDLFLLTTDGKVCYLLGRDQDARSLILCRSFGIGRRVCSNGWRFFTSATSTSWLSILHRRLVLVRCNKMPSIASTAIFCTNVGTMTRLCSSICGRLITLNRLKLFARFVWFSMVDRPRANPEQYLDTQRIHNLIEYLEELHDHGRATVDHTTLLLNCYAKLKDTSKLDSFIKAPGELKFDLETAIAMCRQGGYYEQAAYLATKHGENDMVVDILIEDSKKYAEAVEYIWRLDPEVVCYLLCTGISTS